MKIQDFKMKCENIQQRDEVIKILEENGIDFNKFSFDDGLVIAVNYGKYQILPTEAFESFVPKKQLTYSEFMQLYSEPKQDELIELKEWLETKVQNITTAFILEKINELIESRNKPI